MARVCQACNKPIQAATVAVEYPKNHPTPDRIPEKDMKFWHVRCRSQELIAKGLEAERQAASPEDIGIPLAESMSRDTP